MPKLPFIDFSVQPALTALSIADNQSSPATLIMINSMLIKSAIIEYSVIRGASVETGWLLVATNGSDVSMENHETSDSDAGVTFSAMMSGSNVLIQYTSTSTGFAGTMNYLQVNLN